MNNNFWSLENIPSDLNKRTFKKYERLIDFKKFDMEYNAQCLAGIDEAGRGPGVGPIYAACVVLPREHEFIELNDSKKIPEERRYNIAQKVKEIALGYGIGIVDNKEIDNIGIQRANFLAFERALLEMEKKFNIKPDFLLIDGTFNLPNFPKYQSIKKGDSQSASIAAASILAKTERDKYIIEVCHKEYPQYNFEKHKGYLTKEHIEAIGNYGLCKYHRASFCKKFV